jgi:surface polysaccharide O-acyltransferase-like enzyme
MSTEDSPHGGVAPRPRNLALDGLKCLLALAVLAIHSSPLADVSSSANSFLVNGICRLAVPTFFVINGYYIAAALRDTASLAAWMRRMGMLYLFWMVVYLPFYATSYDVSAVKLLKTIFFGYLQLWYIAALLVAVPMLHVVHGRISRRKLLVLACVLFGAGVSMQYGAYYWGDATHYTLYRNALLFAFPFLVFGYLMRLGHFDFISSRLRHRLFWIGLLGLAAEIAVSQLQRRGATGFDMYASLALVCPLLLSQALEARATIARDDVSVLSSVIYFAHPWGIAITQWATHRHVGAEVFFGGLLFCLLAAWPLKALSRRWPFVL